MPDVEWTEELIARLCDLHVGDKLSFKEMAKRLSAEFNVALTKNALIGKARRLGLEKRAHYTPPKKRVPELEPPEPLAEPSAPEPVARVLRWRVPKVPVKAPPKGNYTIWQLKRGVCHFPLGERLSRPPYAYCGHATGDPAKSYCPYHHMRTHYNKAA